MNGSKGLVYRGRIATVPPAFSEDFATILSWSDDIRTLKIRANADNLYSTGRRGALAKGSAAVAAQDAQEAKDKDSAKAAGPVVKAPAPSSESELDIMVED